MRSSGFGLQNAQSLAYASIFNKHVMVAKFLGAPVAKHHDQVGHPDSGEAMRYQYRDRTFFWAADLELVPGNVSLKRYKLSATVQSRCNLF